VTLYFPGDGLFLKNLIFWYVLVCTNCLNGSHYAFTGVPEYALVSHKSIISLYAFFTHQKVCLWFLWTRCVDLLVKIGNLLRLAT
jgi:hypothetical protein